MESRDEETLELKETYTSLQQEVDIKTKKLKKVRGGGAGSPGGGAFGPPGEGVFGQPFLICVSPGSSSFPSSRL